MESFVYFVSTLDGAKVKIGHSIDVKTRISGLQTGSPNPLSLIGVISGDKQTEATLHRKFKRHRLRGEWFSYLPIEESIQKLLSEHGVNPANCGNIPIETNKQLRDYIAFLARKHFDKPSFSSAWTDYILATRKRRPNSPSYYWY